MKIIQLVAFPESSHNYPAVFALSDDGSVHVITMVRGLEMCDLKWIKLSSPTSSDTKEAAPGAARPAEQQAPVEQRRAHEMPCRSSGDTPSSNKSQPNTVTPCYKCRMYGCCDYKGIREIGFDCFEPA